MELDIARIASGREEDSRRVSGEMHVMKARVEDALSAVTDVAQELRDAWVGLDAKITELVDGRFSDQSRTVESLRAQLASGLESTRMAIEATQARLQGEVDALSGTSVEQVRGISDLVEAARRRVDEVVSEVEGRVGEVLAGTRLNTGSLNEEISGVATGLRDEFAAREKEFSERISSVADRVSEIGSSFDTLMTKLSGTEARVAGGRAGTDASVSVLTQQVRSLETRMAELAEAFASGTTGRVEALSGQVSEVREAVLKVAERVGSTAFLTRRVADLEVRVAEANAKLDRPDSI